MTKPLALIVEDDPHLNEIIVLTLNAEFEITSCIDGTTAWTALQTITPQIIVLDLNLPGMSGEEILRRVRADERFANTRIILATANERQAEPLSVAADIVLLKPVSPAQLKQLALRLKPK